MKLGIWLPIVHRTPPYVAPEWELRGGIEDIAAVAAAVEAFGYEYLCAPEHIAMPVSRAAVRGEIYWDPISTLGYLAARTSKIKLVPLVFVASYLHRTIEGARGTRACMLRWNAPIVSRQSWRTRR